MTNIIPWLFITGISLRIFAAPPNLWENQMQFAKACELQALTLLPHEPPSVESA